MQSPTKRSTDAPMDFQYTSRPSSNVKPVWATSEDNATPSKRSHETLQSPGLNQTPVFGANQGMPFLFETPRAQSPQPYPWAPPPSFSPSKAFPQPPFQDIKDIEMSELSPPKPEEKPPLGGRMMALGGMKRVYNSRQKSRGSRSSTRTLSQVHDEDDGDQGSEDELAPISQNTSNHYTLNMPSHPGPKSDMPFVLLGYLQFFFNFSLVLLFLYLVVQFILTVQRDVEQRISEYSMDIVQEISMCTLQYKNNLCSSNTIPAMAQQCANWETCMNRDPTVVGRAKVSAELIAEVVNSFVEPISWKTLAFTLTSLSFLTVFINTLLSLYRSRNQHSDPAPAHHPSFPIVAAPYYTPGMIPSVPGNSNWGHGWSGASDDYLQTPSRRRRLEGGGIAKIT